MKAITFAKNLWVIEEPWGEIAVGGHSRLRIYRDPKRAESGLEAWNSSYGRKGKAKLVRFARVEEV